MNKEEIDLFGEWCNKNGYFYLAFDMWEKNKESWRIATTNQLLAQYRKSNNHEKPNTF